MPKPLEQLDNQYRSRTLRSGNKEQPINFKLFYLHWNIPLIRKDINKVTLPFPCTFLNNNILSPLQKPLSGTLCQLQVKSHYCFFFFYQKNITPVKHKVLKKTVRGEGGTLHSLPQERHTLKAHGGLSRYLPLIKTS